LKHKARIDDNQTAIVDALRQASCSVLSLASLGSGIPDLLIYSPWRGYMLFEVKNGDKPPSKRKLTPDQLLWHAKWQGPIHLIYSVEDALIEAGAIR
jgi:hypothetical protein